MDRSNSAKRQRTIVACIPWYAPCNNSLPLFPQDYHGLIVVPARSRRRKVKCNGAKPCCKHCLQLHNACIWPSLAPPSEESQLLETEFSVALPTTSTIPEKHAQLLLRIFFNMPHLAFIRQSIHQPSFDAVAVSSHAPFLLFAICSLAALYISDSEVVDLFHGESANALSLRLAKMAHKYSRDTSDNPTVMSLQANAILGFRELCCRSTTGAWMYTGVAIRMAQEMRVGKEYF
jgi:hypothetical protein